MTRKPWTVVPKGLGGVKGVVLAKLYLVVVTRILAL